VKPYFYDNMVFNPGQLLSKGNRNFNSTFSLKKLEVYFSRIPVKSNNLIQVNPLIYSQWDQAVLNGPNNQFFHLSCWMKTLIDTYNFKPLYFMVQSDHACTIPILVVKTLLGKKKAVALPFSDECDIYCTSMSHDELVSKLLSVARNEKQDRLEFRGTTEFQPSGEPSHTYWGHRLVLTKEEILWKNLSSSKRRNIRKAQRENMIIAFHNEQNTIREFYQLHCLTRKRHGLPPQPVSFFNAIYKNIISKKFGEVALAYSGKTPVAGAVFFISGSDVIFKFGASDKSFQNMRANDLLMWEAIRRYAGKGLSSFSFGKTEKSNEGLCHYKDGFGIERVQLYDHCYNVKTGKKEKKSSYDNYLILNMILKKMPIQLLRICGELIYRYFA